MTTARNFLTLNAGSSSLKFAVFEVDEEEVHPQALLCGQIAGIGRKSVLTVKTRKRKSKPTAVIVSQRIASHEEALDLSIDRLEGAGFPLSAFMGAGHRIVHGGTDFIEPARITEPVLDRLEGLEALAPHHMPHNIGAIRALRERAGELSQVGCFDTAFHTTQSEVETRLPLPHAFFERGIRRYGFHGLNFEHVVHALPRQTGAPLPRRLIVLHLGNGSSVCAIKDGLSLATTMGFSTIDGLIMGTRVGAIDPGVLIHLLKQDRMSVEELEDLLYNRSGLLGLSGISGDMRELINSDRCEARFAIDKFCQCAARHVGSMLPLLGGLDAIVFTGGIGENAPAVRSAILDRLAWADVDYDKSANDQNHAELARSSSRVSVWIVPADEEYTIARRSCRLLAREG